MDLTEYTAAYQALIAAQATHHANPGSGSAKALAAASERLRAAEAPVADTVDAVWQAHVDGIAAAKAALDEARRALTATEVAVATEARARNPVRPVLSAEEMDRVEQATAAVTDARAALTAAQAAFKAGATPDDVAVKEPAA